MTCIFIALLLRLFSPEVRIVQIPQLHRDFIFRDKIAKFLYKLKKWLFIYLINFKIVQPTLIVYSREEEKMVVPFARNIIRRSLGIDLEKYTKIRKELNIKAHNEKLTLLHIGDIHRNKFPIFALEVMKALKELTNNRVRLIAVGRIHKGHYKKLREKMRSYGLENIIQFTGLVSEDDLLKYWRSADVFVLFSASEAGPYVVLEAMAHGIPVVATRVGIVPELEARGMLLAANYGDVDGMVNKIIKLWKDEKLRSSLIRKATDQLPSYDTKYFLEVVYQTLIR
ncbi:MAG: glycosyltransferase family 4 protein [Desulfurococcaceae archaeon]